ncbi:LysE family translocator [Rubrivivax rivuli]|uniref:LysE family translocator n=1 Tax=Rubrivivax rivuli TaxID=1862385 RepID=A0A437R9B8_9BURK|nr:LysE family translocator [Rubrivivax rivuli]RVU43284.1 LysE family translocator [Rubrivivax rivuli]
MAGQGLLPGPAELAVFAGAVFVLNATPGVDFLLTVSRTLQGGVRAGVAAASGIAAGCVVHALAAAFGLAALLALHPQALQLIQWVGAAYLVWLGLGMLRQAWRGGAASPPTAAAVAPRSLSADFRAGLLTNMLNPKVALFFLAFLPQFVPAGAWSATASFLLLGAWFVVQGLLFLLVLVAVCARLRRLQARPAVARGLQTLGGLLFVALALRLLRERPLGV